MFITTFSPSVQIGRLQHTTSLDKIVFGRNRTTQTSNFRSDVLALPNRLFPPFFEHFFEIRFPRLFSKLDFNDIRSQTTHWMYYSVSDQNPTRISDRTGETSDLKKNRICRFSVKQSVYLDFSTFEQSFSSHVFFPIIPLCSGYFPPIYFPLFLHFVPDIVFGSTFLQSTLCSRFVHQLYLSVFFHLLADIFNWVHSIYVSLFSHCLVDIFLRIGNVFSYFPSIY